MRKVLAVACLLLASASLAHADIIVSRASLPIATGDGFFAYTYSVELTTGQLDPVFNGSPLQFGTVYDFGALVTSAGVVNNPSSAGSVFISKTGLLADAQNQFTFSFNGTYQSASTGSSSTIVNDNPSLTDIRFTYTGTTGINVAGQTTTLGATAVTVTDGPADLGTFTVYSPYGTTTPALSYDGQTYKGSNNTVQANQGSLSGPLNPAISTTPEPSSFALLGTGLLGILGAARKRLR